MTVRRGVICVLALLVAAVVWGQPGAAAAEPRLPTPAGWPLAGSVRVLRGFDPPELRWLAGHRGVDLAADVGQPVLAAAAGRVSFAGLVAGRRVVVVDHGGVRTTYEPVAALVASGQRVDTATVLGRVTAGGHCPGQPCLHWGLKQGGRYLDPLSWMSGQSTSGVRLVGAAERAVAARRAAERAAAARAAAALVASIAAGPMDAPGSYGFAHPVRGAITSGFGVRLHPVLHVWKLHDGTDFGAACGTPIRAPYPGRVASLSSNRGYGKRLALDHGRVDGRRVQTGYNHAARYVVRVGQGVERGQVIGYIGTTGLSTGCHLHLMVWLDGRLANPMTWFSP